MKKYIALFSILLLAGSIEAKNDFSISSRLEFQKIPEKMSVGQTHTVPKSKKYTWKVVVKSGYAVKVNKKGNKITAQKPGTSLISVTTKIGYKRYSAGKTISVK